MQPVTLPPFTTIAAHSTGITTFNFNLQGLIYCDSGTLPISSRGEKNQNPTRPEQEPTQTDTRRHLRPLPEKKPTSKTRFLSLLKFG
ncbi:hypothetical protein Hanom_Chr16g01484301 [Helianthus anomalus]